MALTRYKEGRRAQLVSAAVTLGDEHDIVVCPTGAITITLPLAADNIGKVYTLHKRTSGNITVARSGSDTINGAGSNLTVTATNTTRICAVEAGNWQVIDVYIPA